MNEYGHSREITFAKQPRYKETYELVYIFSR